MRLLIKNFICFFSIVVILCHAPYKDGLKRSFIPESAIAKLKASVSLRYSSLVNNIPAFPRMLLPGSNTKFISSEEIVLSTSFMTSEG